MGIADAAKRWLFGIAIKKGLAKVLQVAIGALTVWLTTHGSDLEKYGVKVDLDTTAAIAGVVGALEVLRNWLKVKKGITWL